MLRGGQEKQPAATPEKRSEVGAPTALDSKTGICRETFADDQSHYADSMPGQIAALKAARDSALAAVAEHQSELAASREMVSELQHKCEQLAQERDALKGEVERLRRPSDLECRLQELEELYPHLGAAVETIGQLLAHRQGSGKK